MRRRPARSRFRHFAALLAFVALSATATLSWAWTGGTEQLGLPIGADPAAGPGRPAGYSTPRTGGTRSGVPGLTRPAPDRIAPKAPATAPVPAPAVEPGVAGRIGGPAAVPGPGVVAEQSARCRTGEKLVPTCGVLWGVAPGAFTDNRGPAALAAFEAKTQRHQDVFHAYHRGQRQLFPTETEIAIARQRGKERILLLNWKPTGATWAQIARGDRRTDAFLDRLAAHIRQDFPEQFFFAIHHEGEDNVRERAGSGYEAEDYAAMFRHVVLRLRAHGVRNVVTVLIHMAYVPHATQSWFDDMYPGDDVTDWIGFDSYSYSDPGYGHGDFAEMLNRRARSKPDWPGFYNWARRRHPGKPVMLAEWGVWSSKRNPDRKAEFYREVGRQISEFPSVRALICFDTPHSQRGRDSRVDTTRSALAAYRRLGHLPIFTVDVQPMLP